MSGQQTAGKDATVRRLMDEIERLHKLLREARLYVADAGGDEDPEVQRNSTALLAEIDALEDK